MKKIVFSVASRATGRLQIKPSGSGDENALKLSNFSFNTTNTTNKQSARDRVSDVLMKDTYLNALTS